MDLRASVKQAISNLDPSAVVMLYGSRARGDYSEQSDWDFLILTAEKITEKLKRAIRDLLFEIELESETVISSIIENKEKWQMQCVTPIFKNIQRDGIII